MVARKGAFENPLNYLQTVEMWKTLGRSAQRAGPIPRNAVRAARGPRNLSCRPPLARRDCRSSAKLPTESTARQAAGATRHRRKYLGSHVEGPLQTCALRAALGICPVARRSRGGIAGRQPSCRQSLTARPARTRRGRQAGGASRRSQSKSYCGVNSHDGTI
jgi:hypothetical protein